MEHEDRVYYQHAGQIGIFRKLSLRARLEVLRIFMKEMRPSAQSTVVDVGVSLDVTNPEANVLEQFYPHREQLVCAGLGNAGTICDTYPGVRFTAITPHARLPFDDGEFDIGYSNAVIEHVGTRENQRAFIAELCRIAKRTFIVAPNRLFPVEHHTGLPLVNYLPLPIFRAVVKRTRFAYWAEEGHLNSLFAAQLKALYPAGPTPKILYAGLGFGVFASNVVAIR
jgi:hypothetical protein